MLNSMVMLMLAYMTFAPVTNEQHLAALMPLALLSQRFDRKLCIFPLLFTAFNATYIYFATPIFWTDIALRNLYVALHGAWAEAIGPYSSYVRYFISLSFAFLAFGNVHNHFQLQMPALDKRFPAIRTALPTAASGSPSYKTG